MPEADGVHHPQAPQGGLVSPVTLKNPPNFPTSPSPCRSIPRTIPNANEGLPSHEGVFLWCCSLGGLWSQGLSRSESEDQWRKLQAYFTCHHGTQFLQVGGILDGCCRANRGLWVWAGEDLSIYFISQTGTFSRLKGDLLNRLGQQAHCDTWSP